MKDVSWNAEALRVFEEVMRVGPPPAFREVAEKAIREESERNAAGRTSGEVEVADVVRACLTETPVPFRPKMVEDLKRLGLNPDSFVAPAGQTRDLFSPEVRQDPYSYYAELRRSAPVCQLGSFGLWMVSRYDDVSYVLKNFEYFSSAGMQKAIEAIAGSGPSSFGANMFTADPPEHTHLRNVVSRAFTPQSIAALEPRIRAIIDQLLDRILPQGHFDLKGDLAGPLPVIVVAELLGVDPERQEDFRRWCDTLTEAVSLGPGANDKKDRVRQISLEFNDYLKQVVESRRRNPKDDLISKVVRAEEQEGTLTSDEVLSLVRLLLIAATETTTYLITNAVFALLSRPEVLKAVRDNPSLIPNVVEETLRYDSPAQIMFREATRDVMLGGMTVPKGSSVAALIGSANRDERKYGDPDTFDITRNTQGHLAFGSGIHFCLGAPLARLEGRIALETLLSRFKTLSLKEESVTWVNSIMLRGPKRLDLVFER